MKNKKLILSITAGLLFSTSLGGYFIYSQGNQDDKAPTEKVEKKSVPKKDKKTTLSKEEQKQVNKIQLEENPNSAINQSLSNSERNLLSQIQSNDTQQLIARVDQKETEKPVLLVSADDTKNDNKVVVTPIPDKPSEPKPTEPLPGDGNNGGNNGGEVEPPAVINTPPVLETQSLSFHVGSEFNEETVRQSVNVYDEEDGDLTAQVVIDLTGVNRNLEGTYPIVYSVTDSNKATVTVTNYVTVINVAPEIRNARDRVIHVNEQFNLERALQGVSVYDYEEGDLTSKLQVDQVQLQSIQEALIRRIEGDFSLTYSVSDSYGKSDRKTITISIVNDAPVLSGLSDLTLHLGQEFTSENALEGVSANDYEDGDITQSIKVNEEQLNVIQEALAGNEEGSFELNYSVKDSSGKEASINRVIKLVNDAPVITLPAEEITINTGDVFNVLEGVSAFDTEDMEITDRIVVTGSVNTEIPGTTVISYDVTDSNGKKAETKQVIVHVVDKESEETVNEA